MTDTNFGNYLITRADLIDLVGKALLEGYHGGDNAELTLDSWLEEKMQAIADRNESND